MRNFAMTVFLATLIAATAAPCWSQASSDLQTFFKNYVGLTQDEIEEIQHGRTIAKIAPSRSPDEVFVFGAVYIEATPESYLKLAANIDELRKLPSYLAIRKFSDPPKLSDLYGFALEEGDIQELKSCKPNHCGLQLPAEVMEEVQRSVNWSAPDPTAQVNRLAQQMALEALLAYTHGGNSALGTYRDKKRPAEVAETFRSLLSQAEALPVYLPDLDRYLLEYPKFNLENLESQFYWEKVNFGLKPTLRIIHAIVYRGTGTSEPPYAVALKQIYSSHYFQSALDLTVCVRDTDRPNQRGFYLITLKGSQQAGLTGIKGGIVRHVAVGKTRSSLERALATIKQKLEATRD
jgi:hypothetical protein